MKPIYVCQLTAASQDEIRKMLADILPYADVGGSLENQQPDIQAGMDSKVSDLADLMKHYLNGFPEGPGTKARTADVDVITDILTGLQAEGKDSYVPCRETPEDDPEDGMEL